MCSKCCASLLLFSFRFLYSPLVQHIFRIVFNVCAEVSYLKYYIERRVSKEIEIYLRVSFRGRTTPYRYLMALATKNSSQSVS